MGQNVRSIIEKEYSSLVDDMRTSQSENLRLIGIEPADLAHDVFIKILRNEGTRSQFDPARGMSFRSYFWMIACQIISKSRRKKLKEIQRLQRTNIDSFIKQTLDERIYCQELHDMIDSNTPDVVVNVLNENKIKRSEKNMKAVLDFLAHASKIK